MWTQLLKYLQRKEIYPGTNLPNLCVHMLQVTEEIMTSLVLSKVLIEKKWFKFEVVDSTFQWKNIKNFISKVYCFLYSNFTQIFTLNMMLVKPFYEH